MEIKKIVEGMTAPEVSETIDKNFKAIFDFSTKIKNSIDGGGESEKLVTSVDMTDGQYYSLNSKELVYNAGYFTAVVKIPTGVTAVKMRFEKSGGGIGVEFRDELGERTGVFSNTTQDRGAKIKVDVPSGTDSMIFSYLNETGLSMENATDVPFDGIILYSSEGAGLKAELKDVREKVDNCYSAIFGNGIGDGTEYYLSDINPIDGFYYSLNKREIVANQYYFYAEIPVVNNYKEVECRLEKSTTGGIGIEFRDGSGNVTGSFSNTEEHSGAVLKVKIPRDTKIMIYSYLNTKGAAIQNSELFDKMTFYGDSGLIDEVDKLKEKNENISVNGKEKLPIYGGAELYLSGWTGNTLLDDITLEELYQGYDELCEKYPQWIRRSENIGTDSSGYEIRQYEVRLTNPLIVSGESGMVDKVQNPVNLWKDSVNDYTTILINTGTHGDEKAPCWATMLAIRDIVESTEPWSMFIKSSFIIKICPTLNPYGFHNRTLANFNGVNLNRDMEDFTQPESKAWKAWVDKNIHAKAHIDVHGCDFFHPYFIYPGTNEEYAKIYASLAMKLSVAFFNNWNDYIGLSKYPRPYAVISTYTGTTGGYVNSIGMKGFTLETPCDIVNNQYNPAPNYFKNYSKGNKLTKDMLINIIQYFGLLTD